MKVKLPLREFLNTVILWIEKDNDWYILTIKELNVEIKGRTLRQAFVRLGNKLKTIKKEQYEDLVKT